ncbi:TVP38/TMEM64 family protein [Atopobacter sp. AH10]|uniref:TVP38/TMEM64 family protein n=1 Tax=Atopobacter sp. AH10 TaxID=2315861 RepID=UPI001F310964|nr:VTT domain-containing protein [Atopobacter sp. AH10]
MDRQKAFAYNRKIVQIVTVIGIVLSIMIALAVYRSGYFKGDGEAFRQSLEAMGGLAPILFILIQVIQVIYPVIPGGVPCLVGHIVFGNALGFTYNFIGITIGSIINFYLARNYGELLVRSFVSDEQYDKYHHWIDQQDRFGKMLFAAFALPGFPDDFLCMVAGLTSMSFKRFMGIYLLSKPLTLYIYTMIMLKGAGFLSDMLNIFVRGGH